MSLEIDVCGNCGEAAFPARPLCPRCGAADWEPRAERFGTVEETTTLAGVGVASVRLDPGIAIVARLEPPAVAGARVALTSDAGAPVARAVGDT